MSSVLLCGYYGFTNFGDDKMREILTENIIKTFPNTTIKTMMPGSYLKKDDDTFNVNRNSLFEVIKALKKSDLLIFGGGSLFQDATSLRSLIYYSFLCILAKLLKKKYILALNGLGPLKRKLSRSICGFVLRNAAYVSFRDKDSADLAFEVSGRRFSHFADMVFLLKEKAQEKTKQPGQKNVAYILRKADPKIIDELKSLVFWLKDSYNANIYFYVLNLRDDFDLSYAFALETGVNLANHRTVTDIIKDLSWMDLVISVRYHGIVTAACAGADCIPVVYDPKIESISRDLGLKIFGDRTYETAAEIMARTDAEAGYIQKTQAHYEKAVLGMKELLSVMSKYLG